MIKEIVYSKFIEEFPVSRVRIDDQGREVLSNKPVSIPIDLTPPPSSLIQLIHELYRQQAENNEVETFEEANDFDIPDELGIEMEDTPYEKDFELLAGNPAPTPEPVSVPDELKEVKE